MKFFLKIFWLLILGYGFSIFLPFWSIAVIAFLGGIFLGGSLNFLAGFIGGGLLWLLPALWIDYQASVPLAEKIALLFKINKTLLFFITFCLSGLIGGLGMYAGSLLKKRKKKSHYYY